MLIGIDNVINVQTVILLGCYVHLYVDTSIGLINFYGGQGQNKSFKEPDGNRVSSIRASPAGAVL